MPIVTLDFDQISIAAAVGAKRQIRRTLAGSASQNCPTEGDFWQGNIEGAIAEFATALHLGVEWPGLTEGDYEPGAPDLVSKGRLIEVRSVNEDRRRLIVRDRDADDRYFISALVKLPHVVLRGWILAKDAKREAWRIRSDGAPGFFVPTHALKKF